VQENPDKRNITSPTSWYRKSERDWDRVRFK